MKTVSLRRRTTVVSLVVLAVLLLAVGVFVDLTLGSRLRQDLRETLVDRAGLAAQLDGRLDDRDLVDRLSTGGISATVTTDGSAVTGRQQPQRGVGPAGLGRGGGPAGLGPAPGGPGAQEPVAEQIDRSGDLLSLSVQLDDQRTLVLSTSQAPVDDALARFRLLMILGGAVALVVAAVLLWRAVGRALAPLDQMTRLARAIAAGGRGQRLTPDRTDTELGRTAAAFDAMLEELEGALAAAQRAELRLRNFLSDASHELRTPLAGISAGAETLLRTDPDRLEREMLASTVVRESQRASRLVEDLLTVARMDSGLELLTEPTDLRRVTEDALDRVRLLAPELATGLVGSAGLVLADPHRLAQIVGNLLDNARRAAPDGRVEVTLSQTATQAVLTVADSGPGVPAEQRERIFERLVRLDSSRSRQSGGAGLGLPIARALARAHGGDLVCAASRSALGGACFELRLPLALVEVRADGAAPAPQRAVT